MGDVQAQQFPLEMLEVSHAFGRESDSKSFRICRSETLTRSVDELRAYDPDREISAYDAVVMLDITSGGGRCRR